MTLALNSMFEFVRKIKSVYKVQHELLLITSAFKTLYERDIKNSIPSEDYRVIQIYFQQICVFFFADAQKLESQKTSLHIAHPHLQLTIILIPGAD